MTVLARAVEASRRYGDVLALDRVSLDIRAGELVGLLGPNGAGKSTLINLFAGLRRPTSGTVELLGGSPADPVTRRAIGVTPQETGLPESLRVGEIVAFAAAHYPRPADRDELLARFGLDVEARRALWDGVRAFHEAGGTVLLTSHYLEEIEALAERVVVVGEGRVLADGTVRAIRETVGVRRVSLVADDLPELPGVSGVERSDGRIHLVTPDSDRLVTALVLSGVPFSGLEIRPATLEEAFLAITARRTEPAEDARGTGPSHETGGAGPSDETKERSHA
ncbi:ATP-binding cassette domain-containing protein [Nonomuraea pusilla]|uniref:ATP-binding cassette domain-containing protein n=1 Tax=Nonomuraea pusilla TaxID=46177 RepID=UPI0033278DEF